MGLRGAERQAADGVVARDHELEHEAAHLAALAVGCRAIVDHRHVVGPLQQTVEMVAVDGLFVVGGGEGVGAPQTVGDDRGVGEAPRHVALVAREDEQVAEVDVAGLEHAHQLHTLGGLAVEGHRRLLHQLDDEPLQGGGVDGQVALADEGLQTVEQAVGAEDGLLEEGVVGGAVLRDGLDDLAQPREQLLVVEQALQRLEEQGETFVGRQGLRVGVVVFSLVERLAELGGVGREPADVGMAEQGVHVAQTVTAAPMVVACGAQRDELTDERGGGGLREGIARGDVDLLDLVGQTVDERRQQLLVAHDDGCLPPVGYAATFPEPVGRIAGLYVFRGGLDDGEGLGTGHAAVEPVVVGAELVGEVGQVAGDEAPCLVVGHIAVVVVPIEVGPTLAAKGCEQPLLGGLQQVEPDEEVVVVAAEVDGVGPLGHVAAESSLVGEPLLTEAPVEVVVDVAHLRPESQEPLFEYGVMVGREMAEEVSDDVLLLGRQVVGAVVLVEVAQVGKDLVGVGHALVDIVEVGEQHLAPAVEMVERLVDAAHLGEALVKVADELDGVGNLTGGVLAEQLADGDIRRAPEGGVGQTGQVVVKEKRGALVGKDHGDARQVGAVLAEDIFGDVF